MKELYQIYAFVAGLLIGSFLNVVIIRLPQNKNMVSKRSACPKCDTQLKWYHNIPVLSFAFLRGKCGFCGARISWRYPLIEILTGLIAFWLFPEDLSELSLAFYAFHFTVACIFICHFFIDLDHQLLLDSLNLYLLAAVLPFAFFTSQWTFWAVGGAVGFGGTLLVTWLFYKIRGQIGLGGGDIKLYGILGILLGPMGIVFNIFLSCFVGALVGILLISLGKTTKEKPLPFGPSILLVASFQIYFPEYAHQLQQWMF